MESETIGIGDMARASGLTVSALRFYDDAGVAAPQAALTSTSRPQTAASDQPADQPQADR